MENQFKLMKVKELIKLGANVEVFDSNYNTNSLFEMALEAKRKEVNLKIHVRNSDFEDLKKILEGGRNFVTFIFD